jgi:hypothetical protein
MPIFITCLKGPPVFISTSAEQVGTLAQAQKTILILRQETPKLCPRDTPPIAYEPPRAIRALRGGGCRFVNAPGTGRQ